MSPPMTRSDVKRKTEVEATTKAAEGSHSRQAKLVSLAATHLSPVVDGSSLGVRWAGGSHVDRPNSSMTATEVLVIRELTTVLTKREQQLDEALEKGDEYAEKMVNAYKIAVINGEKALKLPEQLTEVLKVNIGLVETINRVNREIVLERKELALLRKELTLAKDGRFI